MDDYPLASQSVVLVEGREVVVQVAVDDCGVFWADFALSDSLAGYMAKDRQGTSPWFELVGWRAPRAALFAIWSALVLLAAGRQVGIEAASDKRASVYCRMLRRAGIAHTAVRRGLDDTVIMVSQA